MAADFEALSKLFKASDSGVDLPPVDFQGAYETVYRRLLNRNRAPNAAELCCFAHDVCYHDIHPRVIHHLLPFCLRGWQLYLMGTTSDYGAFVENFWGALAKRKGFKEILSSTEFEAVASFMRTAITDRIDAENRLSFEGSRASPYTWIGAVGSFGAVCPNISYLWRGWWEKLTVGRACGLLQYVSCLMYPENENPIFAPWTSYRGGGPPCLWEVEGFIYEQSWLPENVEFLRKQLTISNIQIAIGNAADFLKGRIESDIPSRMKSEFERAMTRVELRITELLQYLSLPLGEVREWITE